MEKMCPNCSAKNPPEALKCLKCSHDISDITVKLEPGPSDAPEAAEEK